MSEAGVWCKSAHAAAVKATCSISQGLISEGEEELRINPVRKGRALTSPSLRI
jgi:hypothetical protein